MLGIRYLILPFFTLGFAPLRLFFVSLDASHELGVSRRRSRGGLLVELHTKEFCFDGKGLAGAGNDGGFSPP